MLSPLKVLIVSHSRDTMESLQRVLRERTDVKTATRLLENGHLDPLHGVKDLPDVLMLQVSHNWEAELDALNMRPPAVRPAVLAFGTGDNPNLLRRAMRTGVRDFLTVPINPEEVVAALEKIEQEKRTEHAPAPQRLTAVLNAKGGSGATLVASNLSHIMVEGLKLRVALVDLDLQLGNSALCLNLNPQVGIKEALSASQDIDSVALRAYMTRHKSGLDVLAGAPQDFIEPVATSPEQLDQLLTVIGQNYDHTVVDVPHSIDSLTLSVLARADRVLLVLQQHLTHLHDAKRLVNTLRGYREELEGRLTVVINRYHKKSSIGVRDIENALGVDFHAKIPNDYKRVCQAEDLGVPLYTHAPSAPISKALRSLARNLSGITPVKRGLFRRMLAERPSQVSAQGRRQR